MNEPSLMQLKIIVERAVRPLRASIDRKRKMREELLAHVSAVFDEEKARLADDLAALARTQERFGQAAELSAQLQASVPALDCFARVVEHVEDFRPGESTLHRATRHGLLMLAVFGTAVVPVFLVQHRFREWPIIPAAALLAFFSTLLCNWLRDALHGPAGRSWPRAIAIAGLSSLLIPAVTFGLCLASTREVWSTLVTVLPLMPLALLLGWVPVAVTAHLTERELRYRREWESLPV